MNSVFANFYKWNPNKFRVCYCPAQASDHLQHWCLLFCLSMFFWHLQAKVQIKSKPHYYYCITAIIICQGSYILFSLPAEFNSFILKTIITIRKLNHYILTFEIKVLTMLDINFHTQSCHIPAFLYSRGPPFFCPVNKEQKSPQLL